MQYGAFIASFQEQKAKPHRDNLPLPPKRWKELRSHPHGDRFIEAAKIEYGDLWRRGTFEKMPKTPAIKTIPTMWVFTYKYDTNGFLLKYKARLVVRGHLQTSTFRDTYAATLAGQTFRALMALVAAFDREAFQLDAVNAFTNSPLDETVHIDMPEGYESPGFCLNLLKALYGLRRSPLLWLKEFSSTLEDFGLRAINEEKCLFMNDWLILFFYVDDIVVICQTKDLHKYHSFREQLQARYEMRDLGVLEWFLGIRIVRDRPKKKVWLCQDSYIEKIVSKLNLQHIHNPATPIAIEDFRPNPDQASTGDIYACQQKVGSALYAAVITRGDVAYATSKLSEYMLNPSPKHHGAIDRVIAYLHHTKTYALEYSACSTPIFLRASDAAFADNSTTRKSTEAYIFKIFGGSVDWRSIKQKTVTTSSTEAELLALTHTGKQIMWWKHFMESIAFDPGHKIFLDCDNKQTIRLIEKSDSKFVTKLKHIKISELWLRQEEQRKYLALQWVGTGEMQADGLTKALTRQKHEKVVRDFGLRDISELLRDSGSMHPGGVCWTRR